MQVPTTQHELENLVSKMERIIEEAHERNLQSTTLRHAVRRAEASLEAVKEITDIRRVSDNTPGWNEAAQFTLNTYRRTFAPLWAAVLQS